MKPSRDEKGRIGEKFYEDELRRLGYAILFKTVRIKFHRVDFGYVPTKDEILEKNSWKEADFDFIAWKDKKFFYISVKTTEHKGVYKDEERTLESFWNEFKSPNVCVRLVVIKTDAKGGVLSCQIPREWSF